MCAFCKIIINSSIDIHISDKFVTKVNRLAKAVPVSTFSLRQIVSPALTLRYYVMNMYKIDDMGTLDPLNISRMPLTVTTMLANW